VNKDVHLRSICLADKNAIHDQLDIANVEKAAACRGRSKTR
jgi:hypothetical protein